MRGSDRGRSWRDDEKPDASKGVSAATHSATSKNLSSSCFS
jgi:hypothetical protein